MRTLLLLFSISRVINILILDMASVENLPKWIDFVREVGRTEAKIYVVGNKNDLDNEIEP
jgi:hypothetical protein